MKLWRAIQMLLTLQCKESAQLISDSCERDLSRVEWWAVRLHQISCRVCRRLAKQVKLVNQAAKTRATAAEPMSDAARERIAAALSKNQDGE